MSRLHRPKAGFWIRLCVAILYPLDALLFKIRWSRLDRIPAEGGVILAVNHLSHIDTILMARLVWQSGRIPRFLIKSGVFSKPIVGKVMSGAGQIPVYRGTADAHRSLEASESALRRGECVVIYAEGTITRDPDWWPMQGKTGIARLALTVPEAPVIPVGQWGAQFTLDSGRRRFRPFPRQTALATVGEPVDLSRFHDVEPTAALLREMTNEIMSAVRDQVAELRGEPAPATFYRGPTSTPVDLAPDAAVPADPTESAGDTISDASTQGISAADTTTTDTTTTDTTTTDTTTTDTTTTDTTTTDTTTTDTATGEPAVSGRHTAPEAGSATSGGSGK